MKRAISIMGLPFVGILGLVCGACSNSTESTSGVEGATALSEVGPTEAGTMCDWYIELMSDSPHLDSVCQRFAISMAYAHGADVSSAATIQAACGASKTECLTKMRGDTAEHRLRCIESVDKMTCSATVSDFEGCARALSQQTASNLPDCEALTVDYERPAHSEAQTLPQECTTLRSTCDEESDEPSPTN